jgi:hypothetical protein
MVNCPHNKAINGEFELTMRTAITNQNCVAIQVGNRLGKHIIQDATHSKLPMPESRPGAHYASSDESKSVGQNTSINAVIAQLKDSWEEIVRLQSECVSNPFYTWHALLLVGTRVLAPRNNRGIARQQPRIVQNGHAFPRTFHSHGISTFIPRTRFIHEHKLSTTTLIPRSFHLHNLYTEMNFPRSQSFHGLSAAMHFPFPRTDHRHGYAMSSPQPTSRHVISKARCPSGFARLQQVIRKFLDTVFPCNRKESPSRGLPWQDVT